MTGDYTLTLPVMLAVAIATATSRALSYGTIYTTKLLRRGYDIDRATSWRAFGDLKAADAMRPFTAPLTAPSGPQGGTRPDSDGRPAACFPAPLPGPVTYQGDPQAVLADESLALTLPQLAAYGRDGLPVLSADGRQAQGWITTDSALQTIAREIGALPAQAVRVTRPARPASPPQRPTPLPGYQVLEITIGPDSPAAGKILGTITWPHGWVPVSILRHRHLQDPDPGFTLAPGDRISLLTPAAPRPPPPPVPGAFDLDATGLLAPAASSAQAEDLPAKPDRGGTVQ
jgi:CIC family chloride channel protein